MLRKRRLHSINFYNTAIWYIKLLNNLTDYMSVLTDISTRKLFQVLSYSEQLFLNVQNKVNLDARYRIFLRKIIYKIIGIIYVIFLVIYKKKRIHLSMNFNFYRGRDNRRISWNSIQRVKDIALRIAETQKIGSVIELTFNLQNSFIG